MRLLWFASAALALSAGVIAAQIPSPQPAPAAPAPVNSAPATNAAPPPGKVLFSRDTSAPSDAKAAFSAQSADTTDSLRGTDAERSAITFTAYNLDLHLAPAAAGLSAHALLTLRNDGALPLTRLVLEISSSLHWDAFSSAGQRLRFDVRTVDTDADHTGQTQEAVISLPQPLAPGATMTLTTLYSGTIMPSGQRLLRIGAPAATALASDWDTIAPDSTALRGFGNVIWYPVASPPLFLGDGAKLFQAVGNTKLRQSTATVRLRLAVDYVGDPPDSAFFCGRQQQLAAISDNRNVPIGESPGIATAEFGPHPLGFRTLDLFVTSYPPIETGPAANPQLISAVTEHEDALPTYAAAATLVEPLLTEWFGARPQSSLHLLDRAGQPFEDETLLVADLAKSIHPAAAAGEAAQLAPSLAHSLTHAWIQSSHPWIEEGLAEFMDILWTERTSSRAAALAALQQAERPLALAEPEVPADTPTSAASVPEASSSSSSSEGGASPRSAGPPAQSLVSATDDIFYRTKAAAVWWMLRAIVGDDALKAALRAYRSDPRLDADPAGVQRALEAASHKDLRWFFNDWVYRDRGLPDLSIVSVTPSQLEARNGLPAGWLVAVQVHNDGYAYAEVPVTVRSGSATQTVKLRIAGRSDASTRIVFPGTPEQIEVNDGTVPETRSSVHTRELVLSGR